MLRLAICSDLHLDTHTAETVKTILSLLRKAADEVDAVVIAGDLVNGIAKQRDWVVQVMGEDLMRRCIFVPGNHDYWQGTFEDVDRLKLPFLTVLDCGLFYLGDKCIFGGTLWFPKHSAMEAIGSRWPDTRLIVDAPTMFKRHEDFKEMLGFAKAINPIDVVISHHVPTWRSVHPRWVAAKNNCYFVSEQDKLIESVSPKLWIHGHTHDPYNYMYNKDIRIVCNPFGYVGEFSPTWTPLIVEV